MDAHCRLWCKGQLRGCVLSAVVASLCAAISPAPAAADGQRLGTFKSWTAMRYDDEGGKSCMLWSQPVKSSGKYTRRGAVWIFVTHRPAEKVFDRVNFDTGYTYKKNTKVSLLVDGNVHILMTDGSIAWVPNAAQNGALIKAMRAGRKMVVKGVSSRGTQTTDEFSLLGFTAAHVAINKACRR